MADRWPKEKLAKLTELYHAHVYTYEDMAEKLGVSRSAIAGKISRIRQAQRRKLAKQGITGKLKRKSPGKPQWMRFKPVRPAPKAHPLFRQVIALMNEQQLSRRELCARVDMSEYTFDNYRTKYAPALPILEAMFNVLGKTLQPVDLPDA